MNGLYLPMTHLPTPHLQTLHLQTPGQVPVSGPLRYTVRAPGVGNDLPSTYQLLA